MEKSEAGVLTLIKEKGPINKYQILDEYGIGVEDRRSSLEITEYLRSLSESGRIGYEERYDGVPEVKLKFYSIKK